jgi:hypothetical protein
MTERRTWLIGGVVLAAALAAMALVTTLLAPTLPIRSYSQFLDAAAAGDVRSVTQQGTTIEVEGSDGRYLVEAPTILTDVFRDLQAAAGGEAPAFRAIPAADTGDWLALWPVLAANLALVIAVIALAVALQRRRPGQPT